MNDDDDDDDDEMVIATKKCSCNINNMCACAGLSWHALFLASCC